MFHRIHSVSATTVNIAGHNRAREDYEMFCKFWPKKIAGLIEFFIAVGRNRTKLKRTKLKVLER